MIRYEANLDGTVEEGITYTDFNELELFLKFLNDSKLQPKLLFSGRGGYYQFSIIHESKTIKLHVYLKRLTFGGRENRPYEKRAQFSAALDRGGFEIQETDYEYSVMFAIYKREKFANPIICAWNIHDWGYNIGRAFNCFIDIRNIATAYKNGFSQHKTSIGQIACCFEPKLLKFYIENIKNLHGELISEDKLNTNIPNNFFDDNQILLKQEQKELPKFDDLFDLTLDVLKLFNGTAEVDEIESKVADILQLPDELRFQIHNVNEGNRTKLGYSLAWTRNYLKRAGLITHVKKNVWALTDLGKATQSTNKSEIKKNASLSDINKDFLDDIKTEENNLDIEKEINKDFGEIEIPFDPNKVDIKTRTMSLDLILKRLDREEIDMETNFQRKSGLWDNIKQSRLIESILIRFPLPAFYFDGSNDDKWLVVDGLQRLSSLDNFVNKKSFSLQNLEFLNDYNGKKFFELPINLQRRIEEFEITAYIISPGTPKSLKYNVFKRINTGGLILTPQEIRNAIYNGVPAEFVKKLSEIRSFKQATSFSIPEDRMLDREFTTRFLAFYLFSIDEYKSDLDSFLNSALNKLYSFQDSELDKITSDFSKAMTTSLSIFGDDAFRKRYDVKDDRKPINKSLFEVWAVLLSKLSMEQTELLIQRKEELKRKLIELMIFDDDFHLAISSSTSDKSRIKKRFSEINKIIQLTLI